MNVCNIINLNVSLVNMYNVLWGRKFDSLRNLNNCNMPDVRRFRGLKAIYSMCNPVRISSSPPLPGGERERERRREGKKERSSSMIPLTRLSSVSSGRPGGQGRLSERSSRWIEKRRKWRNGGEGWEEGGGGMMERHHQPMTMTMRFREVGRLITRWRSTSLCRDRQGHSPIGKDEGEDRRGWERGGKF